MNKIKTFCIFFLTLLFLLLYCSSAFTQSLIIKDIPHDALSVDFRFLHPFYKSPSKLSLLSGTYDLNLSLPLSGRWNINLAVPFVVYHKKVKNHGYEFKKNSIGNIYFGLQSRDVISSYKSRNFSFGLFIPTAEKTDYATVIANIFGAMTNYYDMQKFLPETAALYANIAFRWFLENDIKLGLDAGPQYLISTSKNSGGKNELLVHYGFSAGMDVSSFMIKSEFTGILILTGAGLNFSDRFVNFFAIGAGWNQFIIQPSIFYQFNLHEMIRNAYSGSLGIKISYVLE